MEDRAVPDRRSWDSACQFMVKATQDRLTEVRETCIIQNNGRDSYFLVIVRTNFHHTLCGVVICYYSRLIIC